MDIAEIAATYFRGVPDYKASIGDRKQDGWFPEVSVDPCFVEPGISINGDLGAPVWLVDAPGAMGKTAYAMALAHECGAIYVNLAETLTIGSGFVTAALVNLNIFQPYRGRLALVFDALDEAFLRVSFESRMHFFRDLLQNLNGNAYPAVVFGRKAAIMEASLILEEEEDVRPASISLKYFTSRQALELVAKLVARGGEVDAKNLRNHQRIFQEKAETMLGLLAKAADGHFAGYAPVLEAVAAVFRDNPNYSSIDLAEFTSDRVLLNICNYILVREQKKLLDRLGLTVAKMPNLYDARQQMQALARICGGADARRIEFDCGELEGSLREDFIKGAREFIEQHPFLKDGSQAVNAVFAAAIQSYGLKYGEGDTGARVISKSTPSPLLNTFYFNDALMYGEKEDTDRPVPPLHVGALLSSCQALANGGGDIAFYMSQAEEEDVAEVRISHVVAEEEKILSKFNAATGEQFVFNQPSVSWLINGPGLDIKFEADSDFSMRLPVDIDVRELCFDSSELLLIGDGIASFVAERCKTKLGSIKYLGNTEVMAGWPGPKGHPWASAGQPPDRRKEPTRDQKQAYLSFCRLIRPFQSQGWGTLACFDDKITHARMLKNHGGEILQWLMDRNVITHDNKDRMYSLNPQMLADTTGAHYVAVINYKEIPALWDIILQIVP